METDLRKLNWNPHTCSCKFEITKEETVIDGVAQLFDYGERVSGILAKNMRGARIVVRNRKVKVSVPRYRTVVSDKTAIRSDTAHDIGQHPPPGIRLRGSITTPCPEHVDFIGVVQTVIAAPDFCLCRWQELRTGPAKSKTFFGAIVERLCPAHAARVVGGSLLLKDVRDAVIAEAAAAEADAVDAAAENLE